MIPADRAALVLSASAVIGTLLGGTPASANHGTRTIGNAMTNAEAALSTLYANPPLPMTFFKQGDHKLTVMLDYFQVQKPAIDNEEPPAEVSRASGFAGFGGAVSYDHAVLDRGSVYATFMTARLAPGRLEGRGTGSNADTVFQRADAAPSTSLAATAGGNWRLLGDSADRFTLTVFFGPALYYTEGSGTALFLNNQTAADSSACPETRPGYNCVQRAYQGRATTLGVISGFQAGIPVSNSVLLNPFILLMPSQALFDGGEAIDSDHVRLDKPITVGTSSGVQRAASQTDYTRAIAPLSLGLNLAYRPWGLTANLTSSLFTTLNSRLLQLSDYKVLKLQLSKSFGNSPR